MQDELLNAKLNQLLHVLTETEEWLRVPAEAFGNDTKLVRACQRNLQLLVEYASDINGVSFRRACVAAFSSGWLPGPVFA